MAATITNFIDRLQIGSDDTHQIAIGSSAYGVCATIANEAAKVVNIPGFVLNTGTTIHVKFTYTNTATDPTLNVSSTGAKSIKQYGTTAAGTDADTSGWQAGAILTLTYDGTNWIRDQGYNSDTQEDYGNITTDGKLDSASTLVITNINREITNGASLSSSVGTQTQNTKFLREDGDWAVPSYTNEIDWNNVNNTPDSFIPSSHSHGNITNDGKLLSSDSVNVHNGDALVIVDTSINSNTQDPIDKVARSTIEFQVTNPPIENYALSKSGTWATVVNSIGGHYGAVTLADLGLSNALHFVGVATTTITDGGTENPNISNYTFDAAGQDGDNQPGDIVIDGSSLREYLWNGTQWILLGLTLSTLYDSSANGFPVTNSTTYSWIADIEQHTDGTIAVTKEQINILPIAHGGTGINQFTKNQVILSDIPSDPNETYASQLTSRAFIDVTVTSGVPTARAISNSDNFITEAAIYAGLPTINNIHNYTSNTSIYAPSSGGTVGQILVGAGTTSAPIWTPAAKLESEVSNEANTSATTILTLGNSGGLSTTNSHSEGKIIIYSSNIQSHTIDGLSTTTAYTHTLPNADGYFVQVDTSSLLSNTDSVGVVGSPEQPVYVGNQGVLKPITYTTNRIYYGSTANTFTYSNHFIDSDQIFINDSVDTTHIETLYVNGDTAINGLLHILNNTDVDLTSNTAFAAVEIDGGIYIAKQLFAGDTITTAGDIIGEGTVGSPSNLSINGTSTLQGNVGIGCDPDSSSSGDIHRLQIEGSTAFLLEYSSSILTAAHIDTTNGTVGNTTIAYITFKPDTSGTGYIGTSGAPWKEGHFQDSLTIDNSTSSIELAAQSTTSTFTMETDTSAQLYVETNNNNSTYQTTITLSGNTTSIIFDSITSGESDWNIDSIIENSARILKIHNSDNSYFSGTDNGFELAERLYINESIPTPNPSIPYTLYVNGHTAIEGNLIPISTGVVNNTPVYGTLGVSGSPWAALFIGTGNDYGDEYTPIYWHDGVPHQVPVVQKYDFNISSGAASCYIALSNAYSDFATVNSIVVTGGIPCLNAPLDWEIDTINHRIQITSKQNNVNVSTSGQVTGYILVSSGQDNSVSPVAAFEPASNT